MIQLKYKTIGEDNWNYSEFNSKEEMENYLKLNSEKIKEHSFRDKPDEFKSNWLVKYFRNIKNTKKNWNKVRASPYASLELGLKARKIILAILIPWIAYLGYKMIVGMRADGIMGFIQKVISAGIMLYIIWKIYSTVPAMKKQIEHYKKYPSTINYCPTNVKEDIDSILEKIKSNAELNKQEDKNV